MAFAHRVDSTQRAIVNALLRVGCAVCDLSSIGRGVPDLLVSRGSKMWVLECKSPKGKLRQTQIDWALAWNAPVYVVRTVEEALAVVGLVTLP